ncbi:MAG: hypothetical protein F6K21_28025 [Symploca sp. SIO2D2]|nr:hypothetical protein [Symploca sp. SIO2D2]
MIVEIAEFKLNDGVEDSAFLKAHNEVHNNWVKDQPGYIRRETVKSGDGLWKDLVVWESMELAHAAAEAIGKEPSNFPWMQMMSSDSVKMFHGEVVADFK